MINNTLHLYGNIHSHVVYMYMPVRSTFCFSSLCVLFDGYRTLFNACTPIAIQCLLLSMLRHHLLRILHETLHVLSPLTPFTVCINHRVCTPSARLRDHIPWENIIYSAKVSHLCCMGNQRRGIRSDYVLV